MSPNTQPKAKQLHAGKNLIFGTAYYPDHWPETDWARDLDRIRDAGIKAVRFGEFSWSWYEPAPGKFNFAAFDRFVTLAEQRGLRLVLCTPTATPPPWFDRIFPDGRLQDMDGRHCLSVRHFWCWNHAASRKQAEKTIRRLARQYRDCPSLWGWQIDNEPNYAEEDNIATRSRMYDFHPAAFAAFVGWLKARYQSLDALNAAWWSNFWSQRASSWEDILVRRIGANPHSWLDFMRWREANVAAFVHWQAAILREITPDAKIGCNIPETGVRFSVGIGQDYWAQAQGLDWAGTDLYQATGNRIRDLQRLAYSTDLIRSAATAGGAEFLLSETQAGAHERAWPMSFAGETIGPDYLEQAADAHASRGAEQIWWFLWRPTHGGAEIGMNGLQNLDGSDSARTDSVRKLADRVKLRAARAQWLKRKPVYIHYSRDSLLYASSWPAQLPALEDCLSGWHALLERAGFRIEFLNDEALMKTNLGKGDTLVLPHTALAGDAIVEKLALSAARIFAGPHTALLNRHGQLRNVRLPAALRQKWRVDFGPWRDIGKLPSASGLPPLTGYRELIPLPAASVTERLSDRTPWRVSGTRATLFGIDPGEIFLRSTSAQRASLIRKIGL
jgi:beta-galactosidase